MFNPRLGIDWENLPNETPPDLLPYLPSTSTNEEGLRSKFKVRGKQRSGLNVRLPVVLFHLVDIHASGTSFFFFFNFLCCSGEVLMKHFLLTLPVWLWVTGVRKDSHVFFFLSHTSWAFTIATVTSLMTSCWQDLACRMKLHGQVALRTFSILRRAKERKD